MLSMSPNFYRPQTKLQEGDVFIPVCDSVHGGGGRSLSRGVSGGSLSRRPPHTVKSGRYASYWNALLLNGKLLRDLTFYSVVLLQDYYWVIL